MIDSEPRPVRRNRIRGLGVTLAALAVLSGGLNLAVAGSASADDATAPKSGGGWGDTVADSLVYIEHYNYLAYRAVDGQVVEEIRLPFAQGAPAWNVSPNGKLVSVVDAEGLRVGPLGTDMPPVVVDKSGALCDTQSWTPDSTKLLFIDCGGAVPVARSLNVATGKVSTLFSHKQLKDARWTADSRHIIWGTPGTKLYKSKFNGTETKPFSLPGTSKATGIPSVSGNGKVACQHFFDAGKGYDINSQACGDLFDARTGEYLPSPADGELAQATYAVMGPDGKSLIRWADDNGEWHVDLVDAESRVLDATYGPNEPSPYENVVELRSFTT